MYAVSAAFRNAMNDVNCDQRVLFQFANTSFSNEDINMNSGMELTESFNSSTDLEIGLCPSAEITFDLWNENHALDDFTFGKFTAYLGVEIKTGTPTEMTRTYGGKTYAFIPLGVFDAPRPDVVRKRLITVTANDQMLLFDVDMPSASDLGITYPITAGNLLRAMCTHFGVQAASYTFLNSDMVLSAEPESFGESTAREVLGWIAQIACSNARFNRLGKLEFVWFNNVSATYSETAYTDFSPSWYTVPQITGLHIRNADSTAEKVVGVKGQNAYMIQNNPFLRQDDSEG